MKYILYLFLVYGSSLAIDSQEFDSQSACEDARKVVLEEARNLTRSDAGYHQRKAVCVAKE